MIPPPGPQQPPSHGPFGAPEPTPVLPGAAPVGWVHLVVQGNVMTSNMITPSVLLNGYPVPSRYGDNLYPVPPGRWRVDVHAQWLRRYGEASLEVDVAEGRTVRVFYAAPLHQWTDGAIGLERQPRKGKVVGIGLPVLMVVVTALLVGLVLL